MRLALISDLHGDLAGLNAVLAQVERSGGADAVYALGDLVGCGPASGAVLDRLLQRGVRMLRGNWDDLVLDEEANAHHTRGQSFIRPAVAEARATLSADHLALLQNLPLEITVEAAPGRRALLCHAAPGNPWSLTCRHDVPTDTLRATYGAVDADVVAYGHYHAHHVIALDGKLLLNVASVGMRDDGWSALTLLDFDERWTVRQLLVPCVR